MRILVPAVKKHLGKSTEWSSGNLQSTSPKCVAKFNKQINVIFIMF